MRKCITFIFTIFFCLASIDAQNVTITKPTKKPTTTSSNSSNSSKSITYASRTINGHEYVDLGLSVKWATCNVGASSPSDYGNYYAWGETSTKSSYTEENSVTYGKNMSSIAGNSTYDVARAKWGSTWRLPTQEETYELESKCKHEWTTQGGHNGYKITGPNGNSIFLPAAGWRYGTSLYSAGERGRYWSATPCEDGVSDDDNAFGLYYFVSGSFYGSFGDRRYYGKSVRPVTK